MQFDLYFPRSGIDLPIDSARRSLPKPRGARATVLLAEAEPMVREFGRQVLEGHGYQVLVAEDGVQAVELFRGAAEPVDLAVIDLNIPRRISACWPACHKNHPPTVNRVTTPVSN